MRGHFLGLAALAWLAVATPAVADGGGDPVPGHEDLTYFDLVRLVVVDLRPGLEGGFSGRRMVRTRHIDGRDAFAPPMQPIVLGDIQSLPVPGAPNELIVMANLGPSDGNVADAEVLALFSLSGPPRLLDVVEVGGDRQVDLRQERPAALGRSAPLILVDSWHDNSNESYDATDMLFVDRHRFRKIGTVLSFGDQACSYKRTQTSAFATLPAPSGYRTVQVTVREQVTLTGADCDARERPPRAEVRTFRGRYVWDPALRRYVAHAEALERLAEEDRARF
jgi:hypothetical protein